MLLSDVLGRAEHSDYVAVLDQQESSIIVFDPYKKIDKHTIIVPINPTNIARLKQNPKLPYKILLSETKIKQLELILVRLQRKQQSHSPVEDPVQSSTIETLIAQNRQKLAREIITRNPAPTAPVIETPPIEPVREYFQPQIKIQFIDNANLRFIRVEQTPLSLPVFANLILNIKKHIDTQEDINEIKYQIANNKIVFADQTIKNINVAELKSFLKFYRLHREKFENEITSLIKGAIDDLIVEDENDQS